MKIAAISASRIPSTTANSIQVMKTCQSLVQIGHEVSLFVPRFSVHRPDDVSMNNLYGIEVGFTIQWLPWLSIFRRYDFAVFAALQARWNSADLVLAWPIQAALLTQVLGIPTILEMHGPPEGKLGPSAFRLFLAQPAQKRLVFITKALQEITQDLYPTANITSISCVAPNGVELEKYINLPSPSEARKKLGLPDCTTAVYSGHLYPGRGMRMLVALARRFPEIQFVWVGGRDEDVRYWRAQLNPADLKHIKVFGFVPNEDLPEYQAAGDILLMPYEKKIAGSSGGDSAAYASPMKMFEYMACQRPILSSDLPVFGEVLNQANALLCPPEDVDAWSKNFQLLLQDEELRSSLSIQAFKDIQAYSWTNRARKITAGFTNA